ncbi:DNA-binding MarR family transcriptional regulator [Granulicella aggregans]|jgi:DNA-binding MarR family transcriptional regulator|uniref:DNA-binding MarR family transcriptional regulator n=1 Tax=Granulicella aggregans TaxID=474949 RepID=A0A7W8E562_9BACT|nr:DNA-binding MarR family transcriptional regulator [Granulicella aggregans]
MNMLGTAERLRRILSQWVRVTRDQTGTPTTAQLETLWLLDNGGPASIATLADRRSVKHQSMRLVIEQLLIEKTALKKTDPQDRRNQIVSITSKGRSLVRQEQRTRALWIGGLLQTCTTEELGHVIAAIDTLERLLDRAPARAPSTPA